MSILSRLLRPKEVSDVMFALDSLDGTALAETMCFETVKAEAKKAITANSNVVRTRILVDGQKPLEVALNLLINLAARDLTNGEDHTYRGVLGIRGKAKRALFAQAQTMMIERGFITQQDADYGRDRLTQEISEVG